MLEILPIMLALCSMLLNAHYTQNYAGIIGASLVAATAFSNFRAMLHVNNLLVRRVRLLLLGLATHYRES